MIASSARVIARIDPIHSFNGQYRFILVGHYGLVLAQWGVAILPPLKLKWSTAPFNIAEKFEFGTEVQILVMLWFEKFRC